MNNHVEQYTLHLGDCLDVMPTIPDGSIDMILCDLPYGTTACAWDVVIPFEPLWKEYKRVIKSNGAILLFGSQPFTTDLINSNRAWFRYELIWVKTMPTGIALANKRPMKYHENIAVFAPSRTTYNNQRESRSAVGIAGLRKCGKVKMGRNSPGHHTPKLQHKVAGKYVDYDPLTVNGKSILEYGSVPNCNGTKLHPTQKPLSLMKHAVLTYSNEGDTVLDNCMGSGTTGVAAVELGRRFIGIEKEPRYFEIAERRLKEAVAQPDLFMAAI